MHTEVTRKQAGNVGITCVSTGKFMRSVIRLAVVLPLGGEDAAKRAAIFKVLRRGTSKHPDLRSVGAELDGLFGAYIEAFVRKDGENLVTGFIADCIDERYAPCAGGLTAKVIGLLAELLFDPVIKDGIFDLDYVAGERGNLIDRIAAEKNDPRSYAVKRLIELMCDGERYGADKLGTVEQASVLTSLALYEAYRDMLENARVELFYCGAMEPGAVESLFMEEISARLSSNERYVPETEVLAEPKAGPREIVEEEKVSQGKLSIGFRTGGASLLSGDPVAYRVFQTIYGGSTSAKLFMNVREKKSLCYYASAQFIPQKGLMLVSSGIENSNFEVAKNEILNQLSVCREGGISDGELESARDTLRNNWRAIMDDPIQLELYWQGQAIAGTFTKPEERIEQVKGVTKERVIKCAEETALDTVFFLKGVAK